MTARRKLYRADLAALAGIKVDSLQRARPPEPDGRDVDGSHARPWWYEATARQWLASRPGRGRWGPRSSGQNVPDVARDTPGVRGRR
jgi:hypothetical protein